MDLVEANNVKNLNHENGFKEKKKVFHWVVEKFLEGWGKNNSGAKMGRRKGSLCCMCPKH